MANYAIDSATFTLDSVAYCATDFTINYSREVLEVICLDVASPTNFGGLERYAGTATLPNDDGGMDALWGNEGTLVIAITTSTAATITISGSVIVSAVDSAYQNTGSAPTTTINWVYSGIPTEVVA